MGSNQLVLTWDEVDDAVEALADRINGRTVWGIPRGGLHIAGMLAAKGVTTAVSPTPGPDVLLVDDLIDSGATAKRYPDHEIDTAFRKPHSPPDLAPRAHTAEGWLVFPWETAVAETPAEDAVRRLLEVIGENPGRDGLLDTPRRVVRAWREMTSGYAEDAAELLACTFSDQYRGLVIVRDIDFTSLCEHHVLPFTGQAHVGYVPDGGRVVGLSKLARVVDVFARRLQLQERLTDQIADAIDDALAPKAVGVVVTARHECLACRGAQKPNAVMVTSALRGAMWEPEIRAEFMGLI